MFSWFVPGCAQTRRRRAEARLEPRRGLVYGELCRSDLEEETVDEVLKVLRTEFEQDKK